MKYSWFILCSFLLLFIVIYSSPTHAKVGEVRVTKGEGPVDIEADELIYEKEEQLYQAHGHVEVNRRDFSLKADHVQLNMATKDLMAWGNVLLKEGEDVIECQRLEVNIETRLGKIHQAKLFLKDQNFHITGREAEKLGENHYRIRDGSLTTCDAKRPPWKFTVKELEVKEMALGGWGFAKGPIFYFEDIPVLYFPWGAFPVRQERQIGFLIPHAGYSTKEGPNVKTGFYWPFAKNMDTTFYFDWLGKRGFKEGLEYRYALTQETKGQAKFHFIDDQFYYKNKYSEVENPPKSGDLNRYALFIEHEQKFPNDFYLKASINYISDHDYRLDFEEDLPYKTKIDSRSASQIKSVIFGGKNWDHFSFISQGAVYDDLTQKSNDKTTQRLPQISFYAHPQSLFKTPFFYDLTSSYTHFWREEGVKAHQGDLFPRISYPIRLFNVLKFESDLGLRETLYKPYDDPTNKYYGWKSRETFEAGTEMSTELYRVYDGEMVSKIFNLYKGYKWMHIIEPTVSYRYSPRVYQDDLPIFNEVDRIPYTNQITYGFTQRLVGRPQGVSSGAYEYAKLKIFQSYSLGQPFIDSQGKRQDFYFSNIQGELWWSFTPNLSAQCDAEFNPYRGNFEILNFLITVRDRRNDVVQVSYRNTKGSVQMINLDARVKTIAPLYLFGSFRYSLLDHWRVLSALGGEYQAQCWGLGFVLEHWGQPPGSTQKSELKFQVYFNLLNIGFVGRRPYFMTL